jgi:plasmid stabilization system protein ParE
VQDELKAVLRQLASQPQAGTMSEDLRSELRLLSRTIAAALDGQRARGAAPMTAEREPRR